MKKYTGILHTITEAKKEMITIQIGGIDVKSYKRAQNMEYQPTLWMIQVCSTYTMPPISNGPIAPVDTSAPCDKDTDTMAVPKSAGKVVMAPAAIPAPLWLR